MSDDALYFLLALFCGTLQLFPPVKIPFFFLRVVIINLNYVLYYLGMAPNPIVLNKAMALFPDINFGFLKWFIGGIVPGLFCAICLPLILHWACGLKSKSGENKMTSDSIIKHAQTELDQMGKMSTREWVRFYT